MSRSGHHPRDKPAIKRTSAEPERLFLIKAMEANPGKDRWRTTGVCARGPVTMEIGWMTPAEVFLLLVATLPSIMLVVVLVSHDRLQERRRLKRRP